MKLFTYLFGLMLAMFGLTARAELPGEVTAAIDTAGADLATAAGAIIVAMIAFWGLRALGKKMGWWS